VVAYDDSDDSDENGMNDAWFEGLGGGKPVMV